jgi:hypothetical protein
VFLHADEFTLENGAHQLFYHFSDVCARWYDDALVVTEVEPLIAYILSFAAERLTESQRAHLRDTVTARLAEHGPLHIRKSVGMFEARRAGR